MDFHETDPIRRAVVSEDWDRAARLWNEYAAATRQQIAAGSCTVERMTEVRKLLDWTGRTVRCLRAQTQDHLNKLHVAQRYAGTPSAPAAILRTSL